MYRYFLHKQLEILTGKSNTAQASLCAVYLIIREIEGTLRVSRHEFESLVSRIAEQVVRSLPADLRARAREVLIATDDLPPEGFESPEGGDDDLLGLYEGTPLTERSIDYTPLLPDRITLFRLPLTDMCLTPAELRREVRATIIHELGHYFGFEEDELERLGLG